jgi:hypothetical protein
MKEKKKIETKKWRLIISEKIETYFSKHYSHLEKKYNIEQFVMSFICSVLRKVKSNYILEMSSHNVFFCFINKLKFWFKKIQLANMLPHTSLYDSVNLVILLSNTFFWFIVGKSVDS